MGVKDNALKRLVGWPSGVDNVSGETELPIGERGRDGRPSGALRVAENLDLDDLGKPSRRRGRSLVEALPGLHSLYAHKRYPYMLGVYDGNLVRFDRAELRTTVVALTTPAQPMSYDFDAGWIYYTNGFDCGRIDDEGVAEGWSAEQPIGQPLLEAYASGGLAAGTYQVAVTFVEASGRESGSTMAAVVDLEEGQGIRLTSIPQPDNVDTKVRVYATACNGETLEYVTDLVYGMTTYVFGVHQPGAPLETQFMEPLMPGQISRLYRGRHFVARGNVLYWSAPGRYGMGELSSSYLSFKGRIDLVEGALTGATAQLYVAAGQYTYMLSLAGDPKQWQRVRAHPYGAVARSSCVADASVFGDDGETGELPYWLDTNGQMVVGSAGRVRALHSDHFAGPVAAESAATVLREFGGMSHLVTSIRGGTANPLGITDRVEVEVWKDGVRLS